VTEVKRILEAHPGDSAVMLHVEDGRRTTVLRLGPGFCVDGGNALHAELRVLLGADSVF
jgi:DNA polymerase-3 subunit alpha